MNALKKFSSLLVFMAITLLGMGQSSPKEIKKETFQVKIEVLRTGSLKLSSMVNSKRKRIRAELYDTYHLSSLKLDKGSIILGQFRFESFASAGGLGTTRVMSGKGKGTLRFSKVTNAKGIKIACPPLCKKSAKVGVHIK